MQALREIQEVTSNTITIQIPKTFPHKKVEIIVLPMEEKPTMDHQALREIHEVISNTVTVQIPKTFLDKKVEIIVLLVEEKPVTNQKEIWASIDKFREKLARSGRTFSDSAELIREDRG